MIVFQKLFRSGDFGKLKLIILCSINIEANKTTILIVYVDDIILIGDDKEKKERLKKDLASEFEMKDLGNLRYFLGMEFARNRLGITISQRKYGLDLLKETSVLGCKPVDTLMDPNMKLGTQTTESPMTGVDFKG